MVRTVTQERSAGELGVVTFGERVFAGAPGWDQDPFASFDRPAAFAGALARLRAYREAGGGAVVVRGGSLSGRDPNMLADLCRSAGLPIIATTGFGAEATLPPHIAGTASVAWRPEAKDFARWMRDELRAGMVAGGMMRSAARAGLISVGSSGGGLRPVEEACVRAAAAVALECGAAVVTEGPQDAMRVIALLGDEGLPAGRVAIGHCDDARHADSARDREIASAGAYVCFDHAGWETDAPHCMSDARRADALRALVAAGHGGQLLLGCGSVVAGIGCAASRHGPGWLLEKFAPRLREAGIGEAAVEAMLRDNPARLLAAGGGR